MIYCIIDNHEFEVELRKHGFQVHKTLTNTTTHIIVPDILNIDEQNEKVLSARALGLKIVDKAWCVARFTSLSNSPMLVENQKIVSIQKVKKPKLAKCVVIGHEDGRGKYRGLCGALVCEYKGKMFKINSGLSDAHRKNPPKMGAIITFSYSEITKNGPRHPTFKFL